MRSFTPVAQYLGGLQAAYGISVWATIGGRRINAVVNGQIARTASFPEGYSPIAATLPKVAGGMASVYTPMTLSGAGSLATAGAISGSATLTLSQAADLSLVVTMSSTVAALTFTQSCNVAMTSGLSGTASVLSIDGDNALLSIVDPLSATFTAAFTSVGDVHSLLSLSGKFSNTDAPVTVDYGGAIYVADWGTDGYSYPSGTATFPVLSLAAADFLANKYELKTYYIKGTYSLAQGYSNVTFNGWGPMQFCVINLENQALDSVKFSKCVVQGQLNTSAIGGTGWQASIAKVEFEQCYLQAIQDLQGVAHHCQIDGAFTLKPGGWFSAVDTVVEGDNTVFDMGSTSGTTVSMDMVSGWAQFTNATTGSLIELNVKGGEVSLAASCTGGEYYLEGVGTLFNDSTMTRKDNHLIWDETIENGYSAADLVRLSSAVLLGKTSGQPLAPAFRDVNDTADRVTSTVDVDGNRTTVTLNP
jgi:hypothetical protein